MFRSLVLFGVMSSLIAAGQKTMGGSSAGAASAGQSAGTAGITGAGVSAIGATPGASLSTTPGAATAQPGTTNLGTTGTTFTTPVGTVVTTGTTTTGQDAGTAATPGSGNTNQVPNTNSQVVGTTNGVLNTTSGFVTTGFGATVPLVSPPNIALPGSGPATGAPPSMSVNDPRTGGLGSVVPGGTTPVTSFTAAPAAARGDLFHGSLNTGLGTVVSSNVGANNTQAAANQVSVADVARLYKTRRATGRPVEIDNARLEQLINGNANARNNPTLMPPQNTSEAAPSANANQPTTAALDQRDLAIVEAELARSRAATAGQATGQNIEVAQAQAPAQPQPQSQPQTQSGASATEPTTPSAVQAPSAGNTQANANAKAKQQLPATASLLPLLGLFGLAAAAVGAVVRARRRESL